MEPINVIMLIIIGVLFCTLLGLYAHNKLLRSEKNDLICSCSRMSVELENAKAEVKTAICRNKSHTSFEVRMKEVEIEQLQDDLSAANKKIEILEAAINRMWPGGARNGSQPGL